MDSNPFQRMNKRNRDPRNRDPRNRDPRDRDPRDFHREQRDHHKFGPKYEMDERYERRTEKQCNLFF